MSFKLTEKELSILRQMGEGKSNEEIVETTGVHKNAVRLTVSRILEKLGAKNRTHAVVVAMSLCLIPLPKITPMKEEIDDEA